MHCFFFLLYLGVALSQTCSEAQDIGLKALKLAIKSYLEEESIDCQAVRLVPSLSVNIPFYWNTNSIFQFNLFFD